MASNYCLHHPPCHSMPEHLSRMAALAPQNTAPPGYGYEFPPDAGGVNGARRPMLPGETWKVAKTAPPPARDPAVRPATDYADPYETPPRNG